MNHLISPFIPVSADGFMDNIIRIWWNEDALLISPKDKTILLLEVCGYQWETLWGGSDEHGRQKETGSSPGTSLCIAPQAFEPRTCCTPWYLQTRCRTLQAQQLKTRTLCLWQPESPTLTRRGCGVRDESSSEWHTSSSTAARNCVCAHRSNIKILNKSIKFVCLSQVAWSQCLFELFQQKWKKCRRCPVDLCFKLQTFNSVQDCCAYLCDWSLKLQHGALQSQCSASKQSRASPILHLPPAVLATFPVCWRPAECVCRDSRSSCQHSLLHLLEDQSMLRGLSWTSCGETRWA